MTVQKKGFLVFLCSLIPGAGELYMGFRKKGLSIMAIFWGVITVASCLGLGFFMAVLPIVWFYSFFNVHNLKSLKEEEFYSLEDDYLFHMSEFTGNKAEFFEKYRGWICGGIIFIGVSGLWNSIPTFFGSLIPDFMYPAFSFAVYTIPRLIAAFAFIGIGIYLWTHRTWRTQMTECDQIEHNRL